ncbi:uroporphyrinogen-III decarboxylase [Solibacillus sp. FSL K6-1523]|uniref:uroporphyrinogen-III decarboxylase n=1 Tax=Solibacillus sp. FSL K6-1523 TaxID=2921471 RepID=UPI0030F9468F
MIDLENNKIANLGPEQLKELKSLEEKLDVTLIAYDPPSSGNHTGQDTINPS